jgi:hypothetical protein
MNMRTFSMPRFEMQTHKDLQRLQSSNPVVMAWQLPSETAYFALQMDDKPHWHEPRVLCKLKS